MHMAESFSAVCHMYLYHPPTFRWEILFLPASVCLFVCLSVCYQNILRTDRHIFIFFYRNCSSYKGEELIKFWSRSNLNGRLTAMSIQNPFLGHNMGLDKDIFCRQNSLSPTKYLTHIAISAIIGDNWDSTYFSINSKLSQTQACNISLER